MDRAAGRPSRSRQPPERLRPREARADGGQSDDQAACDQDAFAALPDQRLPIDVSLSLLDSLHARWVVVLKALTPQQFARPLYHPEIGAITIDYQVQTYGWHSRHHVAHITRLREREGW